MVVPLRVMCHARKTGRRRRSHRPTPGGSLRGKLRAQAQGEARGVLTTLGAALARVRRFAPPRIEPATLTVVPGQADEQAQSVGWGVIAAIVAAGLLVAACIAVLAWRR